MPMPRQYIDQLFIFKQIPKLSQDTLLHSISKYLKVEDVLLCLVLFPDLENWWYIAANYEKNVTVKRNSIVVAFRWLCFYSKVVTNTIMKRYMLQNYPKL